ncbi:pleckstrin homology domain-containing family O member 1 [Ornithorhynchus anatinus]|uniref:Pleckstrin homology domain containing O1 n=1 Tax=Ornithorhynchus anatinus TaxID=9258 RepID=A0A6I8PBY4_ORNAN|nr:pleckstrin homology domain-containing family O member 1 [Ornithorhynchus anatinus]
MMKKNNSCKRGPQDGSAAAAAQPEKVGWVRKFCGRGIFRDIWRNRYVVLKADQLFLSDKEVKDEKKAQDVFDLSDYDKCEELRKSKKRSKKNHSKFTLSHSKQPGDTAPSLIFLAVSPEEKESWINALNSAITRAKNRILDEVTVEEDSFLAHPTRDRAKIQHSRRPPTRGHLMAVASTSTSDGMLTLDLIQEEEDAASPEAPPARPRRPEDGAGGDPGRAGRRRSDSDHGPRGRGPRGPAAGAGAGPRDEPRGAALPDRGAPYTPQAPKKPADADKARCASLEEILAPRAPGPPPAPLARIQDLVARKLEKTQELLAEVRGLAGEGRPPAPPARPPSPRAPAHGGAPEPGPAGLLRETERLLDEASSAWSQARRVLQELRELRDLYGQLRPHTPVPAPAHRPPHRNSLI